MNTKAPVTAAQGRSATSESTDTRQGDLDMGLDFVDTASVHDAANVACEALSPESVWPQLSPHFVRADPPPVSHHGAMKALRAPLCEAVRESVLSVRVVRGILEAVEQSGVSRSRLLDAAHLDRSLLESSDACVARADVYRLCELAIELTGDPALGLHWAERLNSSTFNPISNLIVHSENLRQGFESLFKFHRLLSDQPSFQLFENGAEATLRYVSLTGHSLRAQRFASEMLVTGVFRMIRSFDPHAQPARVSFEYAAPEYHREYTRVFEHPPRFAQPFTGIVFDRALMDVPSPYRDVDVHDALRSVAERRILRLTQHAPFALRVRERVVQQGPGGRTDMNAVARALGLSARSLRRRLAAEGKSYNAVVNEAVASIAKHLVRNKQLTIQEAAYEMGFADTSTFHRAFKRWTGMTPTEFREDQLGT
jgi:AraC-like DNA-binding protein